MRRGINSDVLWCMNFYQIFVTSVDSLGTQINLVTLGAREKRRNPTVGISE